MTIILAPEKRGRVLDEHRRAERAVDDVRALADAAAAPESRRLLAHVAFHTGVADAMAEVYRESLPSVPLSRCPITQQVVSRAIDTTGIDGPWWRYDAPVRAFETTATTLFSFTGALSLASPVERVPFLVKPGPAVPYVIPALLADPDAVAVISRLAIGAHTGYAVCYYGEPAREHARANDWGTDEYRVPGIGAAAGWGARVEDAAEYDFDLAPWIQGERLRWIAPGDATLALRDSVKDCPFIGLTGTRELQRIQGGEVW